MPKKPTKQQISTRLFEIEMEDHRRSTAAYLREIASYIVHPDQVAMGRIVAWRHREDIKKFFPEAYALLVEGDIIRNPQQPKRNHKKKNSSL